MSEQTVEETREKPRNKWPEHLAWPVAPEGLHAFVVTLFPKWPKGEERPRPRRARLSELSTEELSWVAMTLSVELRRRQHRPTAGGEE